MPRVEVTEAREHLEELIDLAAHGDEIVLTKNGSPVARLTAAEPMRKGSRMPGSARGQIFVSDDFDDPLPDEIQKFFEGRNNV